jgi:drug/metabolite transporter (DMT)-like permease
MKDVSNRFLALLTIGAMTGVTLLMRAALDLWPVGLTGTASRVVTIGLLASWVLGRGAGWRRLAPRGVGWWLVLMGVNAIAINVVLFVALKWTTATNYALLYRLDVVFVVLLGSLLGLERVGWRELSLLPVMLLGTAMVAEVGPAGFQPHLVGDLLVVAGALGFAVNAFVLRRIFQAMDVEAVALINVSVSSLGFVGVLVACREWDTVGPAVANPAAWLWVALLGAAFAVYLVVYYVTLNRMPVWKLRMWMLASPLLVALVDRILWHTRLTGVQFAGMALVLLGLAGLIRLERNGTFRSARSVAQ